MTLQVTEFDELTRIHPDQFQPPPGTLINSVAIGESLALAPTSVFDVGKATERMREVLREWLDWTTAGWASDTEKITTVIRWRSTSTSVCAMCTATHWHGYDWSGSPDWTITRKEPIDPSHVAEDVTLAAAEQAITRQLDAWLVEVVEGRAACLQLLLMTANHQVAAVELAPATVGT